MRTFVFFFLLIDISLSALEISNYFADDEEGAFLLYSLNQKKCLVEYNPQLCQTPISPCSTFKIPSALIALDLGVLEDENTLYKWDGSQQKIASWEKDHTLASAIRHSAIWYFQKIAEQIGENHFQEYLTKFEYGNQDVSSGVSNFWLEKSLLISPMEQLRFLVKLYTNDLPVSIHAMETVKKILVLEEGSNWRLSGKTGTAPDQQLGWFIGHISVDQTPHIFVVCMRGGQASGNRAKAVAQQILHELFTKETDY